MPVLSGWKRRPARPGRNIVKLGNLRRKHHAGGNATYQDNYAALVNDVGNKAASGRNPSVVRPARSNRRLLPVRRCPGSIR